ncbi:MAG: sugar transferase [Chloroflexi bacterium HGW-Chloroflexi-10]|nr:MAG: sugar transferase [Chloroflexi bacterium HGW-Chloroflexi-10]
MLRRFSSDFAVLSILLDGAFVAVGLYISIVLRQMANPLDFVQDIPVIVLPLELYLIFPLIWVLTLLIFNIYDGRKNIRVIDEFASLTTGSLLATIASAGILYLTYRDISRFQFGIFAVVTFLLMLMWRSVFRTTIHRKYSRRAEMRNVLILGAGSAGRKIGEQINLEGMYGLCVVGYLDDSLKKQKEADVVGDLNIAREIVRSTRIDDVVVALPMSAHIRLNQIIAELHDLPVRVWVIPDYFSLTLHKAGVFDFAGIPMLDLRAPALDEYQRMLKRSFDLVVCTLLLPFLFPLMGLIALAIRFDSPGKAIYVQKRVGENGKIFTMYKFRSMVSNAEALRHLVEKKDSNGNRIHKIPDDPRITRVGKFLRQTSLDELPQIFNVFNGSMSLVGPRPEMPDFVDEYQPWQRKRFAVPQGITGWWQVNGRSDRPMHLHTEDDLYYVQHYSIWLDLQILARTVWVVLRRKGAF